jgi:hypothetical protein
MHRARGTWRRGTRPKLVREDEEDAVRKLQRLHGSLARVIGVTVGMGASLLWGHLAHAQIVEVPVADSAEIAVEEGEDTLKDAVDAASPGDTLVLEPGLYELNSTVLIDKSLRIRGATNNPADVHIIAADADEFDFQPALFPNVLDQGHMLFITAGAQKVSLSYFTIKNAPETAITEGECEEEPPFGFGLNHSECMGDAIHSDGAAEIEVRHVEASLNAGNGIWVNGARTATFRDILGINNGAFGIDVDTALELSIRRSSFIANQVSGVEASGHEKGLDRADYTATVSIKDTLAKGNGEIGLEVERFQKAKLEDVTCADNREDGFDADRVSVVEIEDSAFINNLDDGIEVFPVDVVEGEQPADFPGSIILILDDLDFSGNAGEEINFAPTEN